jgi:hypothetical protein
MTSVRSGKPSAAAAVASAPAADTYPTGQSRLDAFLDCDPGLAQFIASARQRAAYRLTRHRAHARPRPPTGSACPLAGWS